MMMRAEMLKMEVNIVTRIAIFIVREVIVRGSGKVNPGLS